MDKHVAVCCLEEAEHQLSVDFAIRSSLTAKRSGKVDTLIMHRSFTKSFPYNYSAIILQLQDSNVYSAPADHFWFQIPVLRISILRTIKLTPLHSA